MGDYRWNLLIFNYKGMKLWECYRCHHATTHAHLPTFIRYSKRWIVRPIVLLQNASFKYALMTLTILALSSQSPKWISLENIYNLTIVIFKSACLSELPRVWSLNALWKTLWSIRNCLLNSAPKNSQLFDKRPKILHQNQPYRQIQKV